MLQLITDIDTITSDSIKSVKIIANSDLLYSLLNGNDAWAVQADMLLSTYTNKPVNDIAYLPSLTNSSKNKVIFKPVFATTNFSSEIKLYPNPANKELQVEYAIPSKTNIAIRIYNSLGQIVYMRNDLQSLGTLTLNVSSFNEGIYFIDFDNIANQKFSVVH